MKGRIRVLTNTDHVKQIPLQEGFHDVGILQKWKEGKIFGLVKPLDEKLEIHVRGYDDNTLDAEIELSREFLEHVTYKAKPYYGYLINILEKHGIPYQIVNDLPPDPVFIEVPKELTSWKSIVGILTILALFFLFRKRS